MNGAVRASRPLRVCFVCDFAIIHARKFIEHFANRPAEYHVTVYSSTLAKPMPGVHLVNTVQTSGGQRPSIVGKVWELVRRPIVSWPRGAAMLWAWSMLREARALHAFLASTPDLERPDVIHALRAQPEGLGAMGLADRFPGVPFLLSLWGADLVMFTKYSEKMRERTTTLLRRIDVLFPDNLRDERMAREVFKLPASTRILTMPAPGGLDIDEMRRVTALPQDLPQVAGSPRILCSRGYESAYHCLNLLLLAFRRVLKTHPGAHLYIEVPAKAKRRAALEREIRSLGLADSVTPITSTRVELMRLMQVCEILAFATRYDGLSMSLLEGMYHGQLPVIYNSDCYKPVMLPNENCVVFDTLDTDAIAEALLTAIPKSRTWRQEHLAHWRPRLEEISAQSVWFPRVEQTYAEVSSR